MKIYRRLLISYLCVCLIPLLLSLFTILKLERNVKDAIIQDRENVISSAKIDMDRNLGDAINTVNLLSSEAQIVRFENEHELSAMKVYDMCKLIDILSEAIDQKSIYYQGFYYFYRNGFLVSDQRTYHPFVLDLFSSELHIEESQFQAILGSDNYMAKITTVSRDNGNGYLMVLKNIYDSQYKEKLACVGIIIEMDAILLPWNNSDSEVFLTDDNGMLLSGSEHARIVSSQEDIEPNGEIVLDGEKYLYSTYPSSLGNLQYGFLTKAKTYYSSIWALRMQMVLEVVIYFIVGAGSAIFLSKRTWSPFESILMFVNNPKSDTGKKDYQTFDSIVRAVQGFAEEKQTLEKHLLQSKKWVQDNHIIRYLMSVSDDSSSLSLYLEDGQPYRILIISLIHPEKSEFFANISQNEYTETMAMLHFAICNILEEILLEKRSGTSLTVENYMVMLLQEPLTREEIEKAIAATEKALSIPIACYISDRCLHFSDAPGAWEWMQLAYRNDTFWKSEPKPGIWVVSELLQHQNYRSYEDFLDRQKKLSNYLSSKNYVKAESCLQNILEQDISDQRLSFEMIRNRYISVFELLMSYTSEDMSGRSIVRRVSRNTTVDEMKSQLMALFALIQNDADPEASEDKNVQWAKEVSKYIRENYSNPSLNASMVADHLNMNLSTLSRRYKNTVGHGVLDEVHMVRLEAAKKLLENGASVRSAAEQTGYVESRAMIRAFKRYEGITPGQYTGHDEE